MPRYTFEFDALAIVQADSEEAAREIWGDIALREAFLTLSEVLGHTDLLVAEGRVREHEEGGVAVFSPG